MPALYTYQDSIVSFVIRSHPGQLKSWRRNHIAWWEIQPRSFSSITVCRDNNREKSKLMKDDNTGKQASNVMEGKLERRNWIAKKAVLLEETRLLWRVSQCPGLFQFPTLTPLKKKKTVLSYPQAGESWSGGEVSLQNENNITDELGQV